MMTPDQSSKLIYLPQGFSFSAVAAGLKVSGRHDLALVEVAPGSTAAALFTKNRVAAAPVIVGRASLTKTRGRVRAVVVNSGNANCATGKAGVQACQSVCQEAARLLGIRPEEVFPSSTGIIGVPLPVEKIVARLPELVAGREPTEAGLGRFAWAIMTTDTRPKVACAQFHSGKTEVNILGVAKGSGMIHPQLATMLVYLFTDAAGSPADLKGFLRVACDQTFNCISVDGDTSTNDTVLLIASGKSGVQLNHTPIKKKFSEALFHVCRSLADKIVADGEGAEHVIRLSIEQATNRKEAQHVARAIAHSLLVKTAWAGADPNWGRILAAVGACGVPLDPNLVNIHIAQQLVCRHGVWTTFDEQKAHQDLAQPACDIRVQLGRGRASVLFTTTDLTAEYVRINADYST
jgi:glutamate N-acetyltransferase / amino-acid N-acetyltransferase